MKDSGAMATNVVSPLVRSPFYPFFLRRATQLANWPASRISRKTSHFYTLVSSEWLLRFGSTGSRQTRHLSSSWSPHSFRKSLPALKLGLGTPDHSHVWSNKGNKNKRSWVEKREKSKRRRWNVRRKKVELSMLLLTVWIGWYPGNWDGAGKREQIMKILREKSAYNHSALEMPRKWKIILNPFRDREFHRFLGMPNMSWAPRNPTNPKKSSLPYCQSPFAKGTAAAANEAV